MKNLPEKLINDLNKVECINTDDHGAWIAIIVEEDKCEDTLEIVNAMVEDEAEVWVKDFTDYSEDRPEDLHKECLTWKVIIVESPEHYKYRRMYN